MGSFRGSGSRILLSSALAMALGLVPLIVVLSIADGMIEGITSRTMETYTYHFQLWPFGFSASSPKEKETLSEKLKKTLPGFQGLWHERDGFALAYSPEGRLGVSLRGIDSSWYREDEQLKKYLHADSGFADFPDERSAWIGREVAKKLNLRVGDEIKILTTRSASSGVMLPRITTLTVRAVVTVGYQELDRLWVFLPYAQAETLLSSGQYLSYWGVKVRAPSSDVDGQARRITQALGGDYQVATWQTLARSQYLNYQATRTLLGLIMALILLVAVMNISTAMVTMVLEKQHEIGILKAVGARPFVIQSQFLFLGLVSGLLGTFVGITLGVVIALNVNSGIAVLDSIINTGYSFLSWVKGTPKIEYHLLNSSYYLEAIPVSLDPQMLATAGFFSTLLAVLASWVPARRAARLHPLEVLRKV